MKSYSHINKILATLAFALFLLLADSAFGQLVFESTSCNLGKIKYGSGPVTCYFNYKNTGKNAVAIVNVVTSCGCTVPEFSKAPVRPGESGRIKITYSNDEGPYPFEKNISVYLTGQKAPVMLHLNGISIDKDKSLKDIYPDRVGPLGVVNHRLRLGHIAFGELKEGSCVVANVSGRKVKITFGELPAGIRASISPQAIDPNQVAEIHYSVQTGNGAFDKWGNQRIPLQIHCNGTECAVPLELNFAVLDDFSGMGVSERVKAPVASVASSSAKIQSLKAGHPQKAVFKLSNTGRTPLIVRSVQCDANDPETNKALAGAASGLVPAAVKCPGTVAPGRSAEVLVELKREGLLAGDNVYTVTLTTNSPARPIINLFVSVHCD